MKRALGYVMVSAVFVVFFASVWAAIGFVNACLAIFGSSLIALVLVVGIDLIVDGE